MESFLEPLIGELSERARTSQALYRYLEQKLAEADECITGWIDNHWSFQIEREEADLNTDYGITIENTISFYLFRKMWFDDTEGADIVPVLVIYIAENATVIQGNSVDSSKELNASEVTLFQADIKSLLGDES